MKWCRWPGLEPAWLAPLPPQDSVSTRFHYTGNCVAFCILSQMAAVFTEECPLSDQAQVPQAHHPGQAAGTSMSPGTAPDSASSLPASITPPGPTVASPEVGAVIPSGITRVKLPSLGTFLQIERNESASNDALLDPLHLEVDQL